MPKLAIKAGISRSVKLLNIELDNLTFDDVLNEIDQLISKQTPTHVVTPNVDHLVRLQKDREFLKVYEDASLTLADGVPVLWAAKYLGTPLKQKLSGSDLLPRLCERASKKGHRVFFLGGLPEAAEISKVHLERMYPGLQVVGTYCPPFGFEKDEKENQKVINAIRVTDPDILCVGLGAPKQEKWIYKYKENYQVPVSLGLGASFDFISGKVKRAPKWMQRIGLEWFWRLLSDPVRLWKRYLVDDISFFSYVLNDKREKRAARNQKKFGRHAS